MTEETNAVWEKLKERCGSCEGCSLGKTRRNPVFGCGNREAKLLFVGEAPGETEDATGIPFTGKAGKLLDLFLQSVGIEREQVYIANILKCRPPHNRDPLPEEEDACMPLLREQVKLLKPSIIVCLGRISASRLIHPDYRITREHGQWVKKGSFQMTAVYHPSALLRDISRRPEMYTDLKEVKRRLEALSGNPASLP